MKLNDSGVVFVVFDHTYCNSSQTFEGITGMLERQLFPKTYENVPEHNLQIARDWGTARHDEMQKYVNAIINGDCATIHELELTYDICSRFNMDCCKSVYEPHKNERDMCNYIASEYTVTDYKKHASNIDLVLQVGENEVILIDYKTYSDFTTEKRAKARWQLSIYRYMFELVNPNINVVGAYVYLYNKHDEHYFWDIESFIPKDDCIKLIECEDNGEKYISPYPVAPNVIKGLKDEDAKKVSNGTTDGLYALRDIITTAITNIEKNKSPNETIHAILSFCAKAEELKKAISDNALLFMESTRTKDIVNDRFKVTYVASTKRVSVDTKLLQSKYPDIYKELLKESTVKSSVKFKLI